MKLQVAMTALYDSYSIDVLVVLLISMYFFLINCVSALITHVASQAWCVGRFLPLLIGDMVPYENKYWENYLNLLRIMEYFFAPVTSVGKVNYLEVLIEEYLADLSNCIHQGACTKDALLVTYANLDKKVILWF